MVIPSLIQHKRDGHSLQAEEWTELIRDYTAGRVPDYQMAALLMAVVWRGLSAEELTALTEAMLDSGDRLRFDGFLPAASVTRCRCSWPRWSRAAGSRCP
jgi:thymidine phosphorylase